MIRVLIADDQAAIRASLRVFLDATPDLRVVAEAADGQSAVDQARTVRPDVVLTDIRMPGLDGLAVTRALAGPDVADPIPVVVLTTFHLDEYVRDALANGACGFLLKRSSPTLLAEAVRAAASGEALISPEVTVRLLAQLRGATSASGQKKVGLTQRELEVVRAVAHGLTNAEIAGQLFLAAGTVKNHLAAVQGKIGVANRVGVAAWAWEHGLARSGVQA